MREERLLKVCVSVADKKYFYCNFTTVLRGIGQGVNSIIILNTKIKALYVAVCGWTFITPLTLTLVACQILTNENLYSMNYNTRAVGWKNGGPGVLPCAVEASFFLELLVPFVSRQKTLAIPAAMSGKNKFPFIKQSSFTLFRMTRAKRFKKSNTR